MTTPQLYYFHEATCGLKARLAFLEKGVKFDAKVLDRYELSSPEYLSLNPAAVVPTLVHGDAIIHESTVIALYADEAFDGPALRPGDPVVRAHVYAWLKAIDERYFNALSTVTFALTIRHEVLDRHASDVALKQYLAGIKHPEKKALRARLLRDGPHCTEVDQAIARLTEMVDRLTDALAKGTFLAGNSFSLADACIAPFLFRLHVLDLATTGIYEKTPKRYWEAIRERDAFQQVLQESFPATYFNRMDTWLRRSRKET